MFRKPGDHPGKEADIWSLAAMMFRLLTGVLPFGVGFSVPVNITSGEREPWPKFMTSNSHFKTLSLSLQDIVERCLVVDPVVRPTAESLISELEQLCFSTASRRAGTVSGRKGLQGWITCDQGTEIFFHSDSVYSDSYLAVGARVSFTDFPGSPKPRAHPVAPVA